MMSFTLFTTWKLGMEKGESVKRLSQSFVYPDFSCSIDGQDFHAAMSCFSDAPFPILNSRLSTHSPFPALKPIPAPTGARP